jgi:predicted transposase/invertase (TIGR01784 family)
LRKRRTLQELTIKDNFMFAAVMLDPENCRQFLEMVLGIPMERVEVSREKSIVYNPEYKGVRLDTYAKDEHNTHYNIEMQVKVQQVQKRSRYYHSQMDMELLMSGEKYEQLPNSYVIFICDYDPIGAGKYQYTVTKQIKEAKEIPYDDGSHSIFLSTVGNNEDEVPPELVRFLQFVHARLSNSMNDFGDDFVKRLQDSVARIKKSREMGARYMLFEEMLQDERAEGKAEGLAEAIIAVLEYKGNVSNHLRNQIMNITDLEKLKELHLIAATKTIEEFETHFNNL